MVLHLAGDLGLADGNVVHEQPARCRLPERTRPLLRRIVVVRMRRGRHRCGGVDHSDRQEFRQAAHGLLPRPVAQRGLAPAHPLVGPPQVADRDAPHVHQAGERSDQEQGQAQEDVHLVDPADAFNVVGGTGTEGHDVLGPFGQLHHHPAVQVAGRDADAVQAQAQLGEQQHQHQGVAETAGGTHARIEQAAYQQDADADEAQRAEHTADHHRQHLLLRGGDEVLVHRVRGQQADQMPTEDGQDADVEAVAADPHALVRQHLAGAGAPGVHGLVITGPAADQQHRHGDVRVVLEGELMQGVTHGWTSRCEGRAGERTGGLQSSAGASAPKRTASSSHNRSMASAIGLAVAGFDQDLEQHPMRQLALGGARSQHAGDVADVVQPLTGLAAGPMGQELQQQRQVVRQLASIQLEAIAAVRLDQIDHGLAAITRFAMDVFEQQQAHRTTTVETGQPRGLRIQRIGAQQLLHDAAQLLAAGGVQRRVVAGGE
ncbi:hypothetical protein G6F31_012632 [Rhizopus arrhizus]|nr:hypothetical protein G6F31_012632 [Rhizopus arrhizus]